DKYGREDGERKDHSCNQQAQAYWKRLFGNQSPWRFRQTWSLRRCAARSHSQKQTANALALTPDAVSQRIRQLKESACQRLSLRHRARCLRFRESRRHLGDLELSSNPALQLGSELNKAIDGTIRPHFD